MLTENFSKENIIKLDFYIWDKLICMKIPESCEIDYPIEIYYNRYDANGSSVTELETINSQEEYINAMYWHEVCNHMVRTIGDIDFDKIREYIFDTTSYRYDIIRNYDRMFDNVITLINKLHPDLGFGYSKSEILINQMYTELRKDIIKLKNRIPNNTCVLYPKISNDWINQYEKELSIAKAGKKEEEMSEEELREFFLGD